MTPILLANFKSHQTVAELESWLQTVAPVAQKYQDQVEIIVAPSFPYLPAAHTKILNLKSKICLAAQDCSPFPPGAYTGAVNAAQLLDLGVKYALVGHSERRRYFHESHADVANKIVNLVGAGITPALCLSEPHILPQFAALDSDLLPRCLYCFEPPADIGGTVTAPLAEITAAVSSIRAQFAGARILYGGSVTADNVAELQSLDLAGFLIGTAALDPTHFIGIIESVTHAR